MRVIAATNRDLQATIRLGLFREDLYYRIAVITLNLPPLRERTEDIELLSFHFMRQCIERTGKRISGISPAAMRLLTSYSWPGNVRELENTIERAVALEATDSIQPDRLPEALHKPAPALPSHILPVPDEGFDLQDFLAQTERTLYLHGLEPDRRQSDPCRTTTQSYKTLPAAQDPGSRDRCPKLPPQRELTRIPIP